MDETGENWKPEPLLNVAHQAEACSSASGQQPKPKFYQGPVGGCQEFSAARGKFEASMSPALSLRTN